MYEIKIENFFYFLPCYTTEYDLYLRIDFEH